MRTFRLIGLLAGMAVAMPVLPQALNEGQGHPLKGVWLGDWSIDKGKRQRLATALNTRSIRGNLRYARPERRKVGGSTPPLTTRFLQR